LDDLTSLAEELRQSFPLHADERFGGISRMPAHLHLLYYQVRFTSPSNPALLINLVDHRRRNKTAAVLLFEENVSIAERSTTIDIVTQDSAIPAHVLGSVTEDTKHSRESAGPRPSR